MAGGSGTRFWPKSRSNYPKQFLAIGSEKSLIEETVDRLEETIEPQNILIIINREHRELAENKLPRIPPGNIIAEPIARNTAACIALAAYFISRKDPESSMIVLPADHKIMDKRGFISKMELAFKVAEAGNNLVTFGIIPEYNETGYGYIEYNDSSSVEFGDGVMRVKKFCEKPDADKAWEYYSSGHHLWNSGMFVWKTQSIVDAMKQYIPKTAEKLHPLISLPEGEIASFLVKAYPTLDSISIDYAVMEKADNVFTVKGNFGWSDVGSWRSLEKMMKPDENNNAVDGDVIAVDSNNNIIVGDKRLIALLHIDDLIIVDTDQAVLICPKDRAQDVRDIVNKLKQLNRDELL